jgi:hypothetical protein
MMGPVFNYVIMGLYLINSVWWGARGKFADMIYWICAFGITATVTWGYKR